MFEKLGPKALAVPLVMATLICCIMGIIFAPIMRADPTEVPFIIVNLDEGVSMGGTDYNIGQTLTDALIDGDTSTLLGSSGDEDDDAGTSSSSLASSVSLVVTQMESEQEALDALSNTDYYGAIIIPENFTSQQISAQVGAGDGASLAIYLNSGKNAQMASTMQVALMSAMVSAGITADIQTVNTADIGGGTIASAMGVQIMVMPLYIMSLLMSLLLAMIFWRNDVTGLRRRNPFAAAAVLVVVIAAFSAAAAGLDLAAVTLAGDLTLPARKLFVFLWACSSCIMLALTGLSCLAVPLGALVGVTVMALGMSTAMLAAEMLPDFWANWVYPWVPQAFIGQGLRQIIYFGVNPLAGDVTHLIAMAAVGVVALLSACVAALVRRRRQPDGDTPAPEAENATGAAIEAAPETA